MTDSAPDRDKKSAAVRVVIVGGGFAGLAAARGLSRGGAAGRCRVTLIDRRNHHLFQPLLYQVATASLSPADIAAPIRKVLSRQRNATVLLGEVVRIDTESRHVEMREGRVPYDILVLACGVGQSYFGHDDWAADAPGLKSIEDAVEIRRRFLLAFEAAEREADPEARRAQLTFIVVGGGPTGVELAGAMAEIAHRSMPADFRSIDTTTARIILVEGDDRLLGAFPRSLSARARRDLERLGVEVRLSSRVTHVDDDGVLIGAERVNAQCVLWAAGVKAGPLSATLARERSAVALDHSGRVRVEPDLTVPGLPEVFVVGDLASVRSPRTGEAVPGLAPAAMQMGRHAARVIRARLSGKPLPPARAAFRYVDKGMLATIGRARAVADIRGVRFTGLLAWLLWAVVHIFFLIGFRNRVLVIIQWAWEWAVFQKGARLITGDAHMDLRRTVDHR